MNTTLDVQYTDRELVWESLSMPETHAEATQLMLSVFSNVKPFPFRHDNYVCTATYNDVILCVNRDDNGNYFITVKDSGTYAHGNMMHNELYTAPLYGVRQLRAIIAAVHNMESELVAA